MITIGKTAESKRKFSEADIRHFAEVTGDRNPIHLDAEYAKTTLFGQRIAHGFLIGATISELIASKLPGPGSIYLQQTMEFLKPVFINDEITTRVEVIEILKPGLYVLRTQCINQNSDVVIEGRAKIKVLNV